MKNKYIDLTGREFGCWTVLGRIEDFYDSNYAQFVQWEACCRICSSTFRVKSNNLLRNRKPPTACICCRKRSPARSKPKIFRNVIINRYPQSKEIANVYV